jgi:F-type H+-transporting ATPase subunit b
MLPRMAAIIETRQQRISGDLENAARLKDEADAAIAAYEQALAEARARAHEIGQKARDEAKAKADAERRDLEAGLESRLAEAETRVASVKQAVLKDVGAVAEETAALIVERFLGQAPAKADIAAAVKAAAE